MDKKLIQLYEASLPPRSAVVQKEDYMEVKFKMNSAEDWKIWLNNFETHSKTKWLLRKSNPSSQLFLLSKNYVCQHSSWNKTVKSKRGCDCMASLSIRIKLSSANIRYFDPMAKDGYNATIKLKNNHSHTISTANSLSLLRASKDTRKTFEDYFNNGMNVAESIKYHEDNLELSSSPEHLEVVFADASINPKRRTVTWWYDEWRKLNLGPRSDEGLLEVLKKKLVAYQQEGCTVMISENPFAICIVTPLMKRAHNLPFAKEIVLVDSTASCDSQNHSLTFLLTPCAAGAVPLCVLITQGQSQSEYECAFRLLKKSMNEKLFGSNCDPKVFITDDSDAEFNALKNIWPSSSCKLCLFHVPQAIWRWLWDSDHQVKKENRQQLMKEFQDIMNAETFEHAERLYKVAVSSVIAKKYPLWTAYLESYWNRRDRWCKAWRSSEMRGNHTNNYTESAVRLYKDHVLSRCKAYNATSLVDFTVTVLETYYIRRLRIFANSRNSSARLFMEKQLKKCEYIEDASQLKHISEDLFYVPSSKNKNVLYNVVPTLGLCSCPDGRYGKFCKHQAAVSKFFETTFPNFPKVLPSDRRDIAYLALGENVQSLDFYEALVPSKHTQVSHHHLETNLEETSISNLKDEMQNESNMNTSCETPTQCDNGEASETDFEELANCIKNCNSKFGSSKTGIKKLSCRLKSFTSKGQWESFLHQGCFIRTKEGSAIHTQPTSRSRRREGVTKGAKKLPAGRPPKSEKTRRKRLRNLSKNIKECQPNAKSH